MHPSPSIQLKQTTNNNQQIHTASQHTKNHYVLNTKSPLQQWEWRADPVSKWRSAGTMNASFPNGFLRPKQSLRLHLAMTHHASRCQQVMVVVNPLHHFQRILLSLLSAVLYELDKKATIQQTRLPANVICLNNSTEDIWEDVPTIALENWLPVHSWIEKNSTSLILYQLPFGRTVSLTTNRSRNL